MTGSATSPRALRFGQETYRTCSDCGHMWKQVNQGGPMCGRPGPGTFDVVNGPQGRASSTCESERSRIWRWLGSDVCGPEGQYWVVARPLLPPTGGSAVKPPARPSR